MMQLETVDHGSRVEQFSVAALAGLMANPAVLRDISRAESRGTIKPDQGILLMIDEARMVAEACAELTSEIESTRVDACLSACIEGLLSNPENSRLMEKRVFRGEARAEDIPYLNVAKSVGICQAMMETRAKIGLTVPDPYLDVIDQYAFAAVKGLLANVERWRSIEDLHDRGEISSREASLMNAREAYFVAMKTIQPWVDRDSILETSGEPERVCEEDNTFSAPAFEADQVSLDDRDAPDLSVQKTEIPNF